MVNPQVAYYHVISDRDVPHVRNLYPIRSVKQFREDLDTFLKLYRFIDLHELLETVRTGRPLASNSFLLTFDDGFREISDVVAPILFEKGVSSVFFLNSGFLDNKGMAHHNKISLLLGRLEQLGSRTPQKQIARILHSYGIENPDLRSAFLSIEYGNREAVDQIAAVLEYSFNDYLATAEPYLTSEQVRTLINKGFTIGAHSVDHPLYSALPLEEQLSQTRDCIQFLREQFSLGYGAFAFPHGDTNVSQEFFEAMFAEGDVEVSFGTRGMINCVHPRHFHRFSMEYDSAPTKKVLGHHFARGLFKSLAGREL